MEYVTVLNIAILTLDIRAWYRRPDSIYLFFKFCFSLIIGFGILFLQLMNATVGYKFVLPDLGGMELCYLIGYVGIITGSRLGIWTYLLLTGSQRPGIALPFGEPEAVRGRYGLYSLGIISMLAVVLYVGVTGFSFGQGSYEARYEDAQGMGIILRLFPAFLPFAAYKLTVAKSPREFWRSALVLVGFTFVMLIALEGYRQLMISAALLTVIIALKRKYVPLWVQLAIAVSALPALVSLSFLRYGGEVQAAGFTDPLTRIFYYIQGDLFPLDAPIRIIQWCDIRDCPGLEVFWNHLTLLVPRFLWPDKPAILLDAAGYYTQIVIAYNRALTLSATIIGEGFLIGSFGAIFAICVISGWLARILSVWMDRSTGMIKFILLANVPMGFFWVREGLENGILRTIFILAFLGIGTLTAPITKAILSAVPIRPRATRGGNRNVIPSVPAPNRPSPSPT